MIIYRNLSANIQKNNNIAEQLLYTVKSKSKYIFFNVHNTQFATRQLIYSCVYVLHLKEKKNNKPNEITKVSRSF